METTYYSQNGEDFLLNQYFTGKKGFFVEVGCIDGRRFSNTYHFELKGWTGLCVEAHQGYIDLLKANRPNSVVVNCAVGETNEDDVTFYANARGSLSSLDPSSEERWKRDYAPYFSGFQEQRVRKRTLTAIFEENQVPQIDLLSLDIEGYEVEALQGLDFRRYKPLSIVVESDFEAEHRQKINKLLTKNGYEFAAEWSGNLYYSILPDFQKALAGKVFPDVTVIHTQHPLDTNGDASRVLTIDTRPQSKPRGIASRLRALLGGRR